MSLSSFVWSPSGKNDTFYICIGQVCMEIESHQVIASSPKIRDLGSPPCSYRWGKKMHIKEGKKASRSVPGNLARSLAAGLGGTEGRQGARGEDGRTAGGGNRRGHAWAAAPRAGCATPCGRQGAPWARPPPRGRRGEPAGTPGDAAGRGGTCCPRKGRGGTAQPPRKKRKKGENVKKKKYFGGLGVFPSAQAVLPAAVGAQRARLGAG